MEPPSSTLTRRGSTSHYEGDTLDAAGDLVQIAISNEGLRAITLFAGAIAGDSGIIAVGKVYRWDVGGSMVGGIGAELSPEADELFRVFVTGSVGGVQLLTQEGTITRVEVGGAMQGTITALDEGIKTVEIGGNMTGTIQAGEFIDSVVVAGDIGTNTVAATIRTFDAGAPIGAIEAVNINANITAGVNGRGDIGQILATGASFFKGSINALDLEGIGEEPAIEAAGNLEATIAVSGSVEAPIKITGDLNANLTVGGSVNAPIEIGGVLSSGNMIRIRLSLDDEAPITIGESDGLEGQIIINAAGLDQGSWSGDVIVGSTTLSPVTAYEQLPSSLGGGAVGYAGFNFHAWACSPQHEEELSSPPSSVVVDHYGPVINTATPCNPTCPPPLMVEHRNAGSEDAWTDQTAQMDFAVENSYPFRHLTITPTSGHSFLSDKEYRITPQYVSGGSGMTRLKSRYDSNTIGVQVYDYRFTIISGSFAP